MGHGFCFADFQRLEPRNTTHYSEPIMRILFFLSLTSASSHFFKASIHVCVFESQASIANHFFLKQAYNSPSIPQDLHHFLLLLIPTRLSIFLPIYFAASGNTSILARPPSWKWVISFVTGKLPSLPVIILLAVSSQTGFVENQTTRS